MKTSVIKIFTRDHHFTLNGTYSVFYGAGNRKSFSLKCLKQFQGGYFFEIKKEYDEINKFFNNQGITGYLMSDTGLFNTHLLTMQPLSKI